ncbi:acetoin utilization protein AcuC [Acidisoma cellulosilyticum]|uniref:acetoin utilization protein AcuC n=1 Tax=Acidisoma cellulosilyticum TaxID=2802395 RepID=UPI001D0B7E6C|nr:acetoin utilization protein AcuC [Acidisoma cellulosilyticum]
MGLVRASATPPLFIGSDIYRFSTYGPTHPLAVPRVSTTIDLCRALGWLPDRVYRDSPMADLAELSRFHDPAYLAALQNAERSGTVSVADRDRFRIGTDNNPVYPEMFRRPATSAGGVMLAARLTAPLTGEGGIVHVPGGGTHHGRADRASGFCYVNDCVLGILTWLDRGLERVLYLDLDAHHGDGVQDAFAGDPRVLTVSIHEAGRWPHTGLIGDRAGGSARNLPVLAGYNDTEARFLLHEAVLPLIQRFRPQAIMLQCGADSLEEDPLARLSLSNNAYWAAVAAVMPLSPRLILLGGGGYNPFTVARCWAGIWATVNGFQIPEILPTEAETILRGLVYNRAAGRNPPAHWTRTLRDQPREGPVREEIRQLAAVTLQET